MEWNEKCYYADGIFLNGPMNNLLFYCHIFIHAEKVTSEEKFSHNLTLEVQNVWKTQCFNAIYGRIEMLKNS